MSATPSELEQALRWTEGLEGDTQPMECPPQVLALCHRLLCEMAADFARWTGPECECEHDKGEITATQRCSLDAAREKWRLPK